MKNSIKIWPDLDDITQAIVPYSDKSLNAENSMHIDMSNVCKANSSGAVMTLVKLVKLIEKNKNSRWSIEESSNQTILNFFKIVGFNNLLSARIQNKDLLWNLDQVENPEVFTQTNLQNIITKSFPIYYLEYSKSNYRMVVEDYNDWIIDNITKYANHLDFKINIFAKLLKEIAKNSEDHTNNNAFFGFDILENSLSKKALLLFSFCDLGVGIHENIKKHISSDKRFRIDAAKKFGIVDSYQYAFTPGFTTSVSSKNKGIGMAMILDCVKLLKMELSIFDARSRGFVPDTNSHSEIRRNFWNTGNPVGFYYYGKMNLEMK